MKCSTKLVISSSGRTPYLVTPTFSILCVLSLFTFSFDHHVFHCVRIAARSTDFPSKGGRPSALCLILFYFRGMQDLKDESFTLTQEMASAPQRLQHAFDYGSESVVMDGLSYDELCPEI